MIIFTQAPIHEKGSLCQIPPLYTTSNKPINSINVNVT